MIRETWTPVISNKIINLQFEWEKVDDDDPFEDAATVEYRSRWTHELITIYKNDHRTMRAEGDDLRNWIQMWPLDNSRVDYEDLSVWEGQVLLIHINYPQANEFQTVTWAIIVSWETIKFKYTALLRPRELLLIFQIEEELPTRDYWLPNDKYWGGGKSCCEAEIVGTAEILDDVGISVSDGKDDATLPQPATVPG